jgi:hypothetical protein
VLVTAGVPAASNGRHVLRTLVAAFDPQGRQSGQQVSKTIEITRAQVDGRAEFATHLQLRPGRYEVRIAAEDEGSHVQASVSTFVSVPDLGREELVMSDVITTRHGSTGQAVEPTLQRTFTTAETPTFLARLFRGRRNAPEPVAVLAQVFDAGDRSVFERRSEFQAAAFAGGRHVDVELTLPVASWHPGDYLLSVEASSGGRTAVRRLQFHVSMPAATLSPR